MSIISLPIDEAKKEYGPLLRDAGDTGLFVYIPPKMEVHEFRVSADTLYLFVGRGAKLTFKAETPEIILTMEEGAKASFSTKESVRLRAVLKTKATFEMVSNTTEAELDLSAHLLGEESSASFMGLTRLCEKQKSNITILIRHVAPNCTSYQHFKAVVRGSAKSSFTGKIYVEREAQKTDAYQLSNALLLGERALASARPNLEVFADDVKASHGATVGQLSQEEVFYLMSRGLSKEAAQEYLIQGFCNDILRLCGEYA